MGGRPDFYVYFKLARIRMKLQYVIALAGWLLTQQATGQNLLQNGSFEGGSLAGWDPNGATVVNTDSHHGSWSARLSNTVMYSTFDTTPGLSYKVTAWIRILSEVGADWGGFHVQASDASWNTLAQTPWITQTRYGSAWFKVAIRFTAVSSVTRVHVGYFGGPNRSMTCLVDDVRAIPHTTNQPPAVIPALTPTYLASVPAMQNFAYTGEDPDGAIERVHWVFGDGACSTQHAGSRRVAIPGNYTARLRVGDDDGSFTEVLIPWSCAGTGFPQLAITNPIAYELTTSSPLFSISGVTTGTGMNIVLTSDRHGQTTVSGSNVWHGVVELLPGWNRVLVQGRDANARVVTSEKRIRYIPPDPVQVVVVSETSHPVERWDLFEAAFVVKNSAATHPHFAFSAPLIAGLEALDGIRVDVLFTPDNWATVYRRPAYYHIPHSRELKSNREWLYPSGAGYWCVRFAPPSDGIWKWKVEVEEAKGTTTSQVRSFLVVAPTLSTNHGPVQVSPSDSRYFIHADGKVFLGAGHNIGVSPERFSYDMEDQFAAIGEANQDFFRWWIAGAIWGSAWTPWASRSLSYDGYLPPTSLSFEAAYGHGITAWKLDSTNPILFHGFQSGLPPIVPGKTYRLALRWKTDNVTGPQNASRPYGVCVRWGGWPEVGQTHLLPLAIPHTAGDTPWHVVSTTFTASGPSIQDSHYLANIVIALENTTGGAAYIDECSLREVLSNGSVGPELLRRPRANMHLDFDERRAAGIDAALRLAHVSGKHFKLVISEKNDHLLNRIGPDGLPDPNGGRFNQLSGPLNVLHRNYWRYLFARYGAYRSVHSWELVNEEAPGPTDHFRFAAQFALAAANDGNPHLASTSTWATLAEDAWKWPPSAPLSYVDFHCYVNNTGWIEPKLQLTRDSARFFSEYDQAAFAAAFGKPVVWGEMGIDGPSTSDEEEPLLANDTSGVWLHKILWARCGKGGVYPLYWYTDNIFSLNLHYRFGAWKRFMESIPLANGFYVDAQATATSSNLRVFGQKDLIHKRAHLWIDNVNHTWYIAATGHSVSHVSGEITLSMSHPYQAYALEWWNTEVGTPISTEFINADSAGDVTITIQNLLTDIALKLSPLPSANVSDWEVICN
ncbi:MAG: PKD domain-containing protein [Candidatus Sumerlaea chitinivorans]|jgi:hypothetical protein|nr:PKD domain-containing protein [Candidatus Sumerlaea chitinivorans]